MKRFRSVKNNFAYLTSVFVTFSFATASVQVDFGHSYTSAPSANQNTGDITLDFTVDTEGSVTLDASSSLTPSSAYVDEFDGAVGNVSDPGMRGQSFSIALSSTGSGNLRINNTGDGLSVQGGNAQLIDANGSAVNEVITARVSSPSGQFQLLGVGYLWRLGSSGINVSDTNYPLSDTSGLVDVSNQGITGDFSIASSSDQVGQGFVLSQLTFDFVERASSSEIGVSFANSGTGFGEATNSRTLPWVPSGNGQAAVILSFSINQSGAVSLSASTDATDSLFQNAVGEWSRSSIGRVTDPELLNQSFTLTGTRSGGVGGLSITELGGGGIGIQGENPNRIDGLNYGPDEGTSTPETLTWTLSAPPGLLLTFTDWSYSEGAGGDLRVSTSSGSLEDFANLTSPSGTKELDNLTLENGQTLAFQEIPDSGPTTGAAIAGFSFHISSQTTLSQTIPFNNENGDRRWSTPANWSTGDLPKDEQIAEIAGYDVIIDSTAPNLNQLKIINGSVTLSTGGTLLMSSMEIGRNIEKRVGLIIEGSDVAFGYSGEKNQDEFAVGTAATIETNPDTNGCMPLNLGTAKLTLDLGSQWILDGSNYSGPFNLGDRFVLANYGSFSGSTGGIRSRNFDLPSNRRLKLIQSEDSLYYEIIEQTAAIGPNIIIINTDDQAADQHFGFDGRDCLTPTLDSLASTGLRFTSAFAASTVCGPSRYSLLTSRWPSRNTSAQFLARYPLGTLGRFGVSDTELEPDGENIAAWLQRAGYRTGMVGKGHLIDDDLTQTGNWSSKGLLTYPQNADPALDANTNGRMSHNYRIVCQRMRTFGFDYVASYYKANLAELRSEALNVHNQEWVTKGALDFIEENHSERFFLYMAPTINHGPVRDDLTKTLRANKSYTGAGYLPDEDYSFMPDRQSIINEVTSAGKNLISARETWLDYSVAAIINKLAQHNLRNDTLIIFTSDHGEKTLTKPLIWGKSSLFDLGMKVPLVMNWPNGIQSAGRTYDELVSHVDIVPTLLSLAGASSLPARPIDGVNLTSVLNGGSEAVREDLFCEIGYARAVRTKDKKYVAVRYTPPIDSLIENGHLWERIDGNNATGQFTEPRPYYVNNPQLGSLAANSHPNNTYFADDQLYDLQTDPNENENIYGQEPGSAYHLKRRLAHYLGDIPNRPFRQYSGSSSEFSPTPPSTPLVPGALQMQFLDLNSVKLNWKDLSEDELGYVIRKKVNGAPPEIISELPTNTESFTVSLDPGVEDIVIEVSSYNEKGDSTASIDLIASESWRFRTFGDIDPTLSLAISQWSSDADSDGVSNLWEYAFGTDPRSPFSVGRPEVRIRGNNEEIQFLEYWLPRSRRRGLNFSGDVSSTLSGEWLSGPPHCLIIEDEEDHLLFRSAVPINESPKQFIRTKVLNPPSG